MPFKIFQRNMIPWLICWHSEPDRTEFRLPIMLIRSGSAKNLLLPCDNPEVSIATSPQSPTIWTNWHQRNPNGADDPERRERRSGGCATSCFSAGAAKAETACVPSFPQRRRLPVAGKHLEGQQLPEEATPWGTSCQSSRNPPRV